MRKCCSRTWYRATDQELHLTAPFYVPPWFGDWCILAHALGVDVCGPSDLIVPGGLIIELQEWPVPPIPVPLPDPPPLRKVGIAFELTFRDARSGEAIQELPNTFEIRMSYTDRQLADIFKVQDEIAGAIVDRLKIELAPEEQKLAQRTRAPTQNVEAYELYLQGRAVWKKRATILTKTSAPSAARPTSFW